MKVASLILVITFSFLGLAFAFVVGYNSQQFSELLRQHAYAVADAYAKTQEEQRMMRRALDESFRRPYSRHNGILDTAFPSTTFITVNSFNSGYQSSRQQVNSAREAASASSSSSTGYGSSGGSFSGSGSSSRF